MKIVSKVPENKCCDDSVDKSNISVGLSKPGPPGKGATIEIQNVLTIEPSDQARVENVGDESAVKLIFYIPKGDPGNAGPQGARGDPFTYEDFTPEQLEALKGETGPQGAKGEIGPQGPRGETGPQGKQGETGAQGASGYTPVRGTDYWTATDKEEIVDQSVKEVKEYVDVNILGGAS